MWASFLVALSCARPPSLADLGLVALAQVEEDGTHTFEVVLADVPQSRGACTDYRLTYGLDDVRHGEGLTWGGGYVAFDPQVGGIDAEGDTCTDALRFTVDPLVALPSPTTLWVEMGAERAEAVFLELDGARALERTDDAVVHGYAPFTLRYTAPEEEIPSHGWGELRMVDPDAVDAYDGLSVLDLVVEVSGPDVLAAVSPEETWEPCDSRCGRDFTASLVVWAEAAVDRCDGFAACGASVATVYAADLEWSLRE